MNNEIGRKITSLTLMTIMLAGGMVIGAPSMVPSVHAANPNLFVSAENSQFDNYMSGPQVIEVVVIDSDLNETDEGEGEPDVTVNGKILRMAQATDGNWYGYFSDREMATIADATVNATSSGIGLDYGSICTGTNSTAASTTLFGFGDQLSDTNGVAIGATDCNGAGADPTIQNVLREAKSLSNHPNPEAGQIGVVAGMWPFIQLYTLSEGGNVVVTYNKGGGVQSTTLTFDDVDEFASIELDRASYTPGAPVHATITDLWLNIDPTDEDSWTFGTTGTGEEGSTNYQVFNENGIAVGDVESNTDENLLTGQLDDLMCEDNCRLITTTNADGTGNVITLSDNNDSVIAASDIEDPFSWATDGGFLAGEVPVTITEQGPNSGVFGTYDESDTSNIVIRNDAQRGTSASIDYNETGISILIGLGFATVDMIAVDDEWNSGEEISVELFDEDANKNSRSDEDLDLNNPNVDLIPTLRTGTPATLGELDVATFTNGTTTVDLGNEVQGFSDRAILTTGAPIQFGTTGDTLNLQVGTMDDFYDAAPINDADFHGFALLNYDIRSLENDNNNDSSDNASIDSIDISINDVSIATDVSNLQGLILLDQTHIDALDGISGNTDLDIVFTVNTGSAATAQIPANTELPIVVDIFGYGFLNDGLEDNERIANQIIRLELEETGDNTSLFEGSLEYIMINQLNILDSDTYADLSTIADDPSFIVIEDLDDEESPRVTYFDVGSDGVATQVSDQLEAPSHSGIVSFDKDSYKIADTVEITLEDTDLNTDVDLIDIYTTVTSGVLKDVVGDDANTITLPNGDELGRLLDVTFDDQLWTDNNDSCVADLRSDDTGLASTGFTLIETGTESGVFTGNFQIPLDWCRAGATSPESSTGLDLEVNYVDFRDASGETIEVNDSAGIRASTGSISLDRTVYPVPFGVPTNFGDLSGDTSPDNRSIFAIHASGINDDLTTDGTFLPNGDLTVHIRVNDPDFDVSASGEDEIAQNRSDIPIGPVEISIIRGSDTVILGYAGGEDIIDGTINVGDDLVGDGSVEEGEITIESSTEGFGGFTASGDPSNFVSAGPADITITQGDTVATAQFTDTGVAGLDSGSELSNFAASVGTLDEFTNGPIVIEDVPASEEVGALFTNSGATGLGSGSEINEISSFTSGSVLICQSGMSNSDCATGTFVNLGTGSIAEDELRVITADNNMVEGSVTIAVENTVGATFTDDAADGLTANTELTAFVALDGDLSAIVDGEVLIIQDDLVASATFTDDAADGLTANTELTDFTVEAGELEDFADNPVTITQLTNTATADWDDENNDTNIDDGELTIENAGTLFDGVDTVIVRQNSLTAVLEFNDALSTLEDNELSIDPSPSGNGFTNGEVTITPNPSISGVSAVGNFVDNPTIRQFGPMDEIAPDAGIFEIDLSIQYTDGPADERCPTTLDFDADESGTQGELTRFNSASSSGEDYCILQGDILQVEYTDPADASGDENSVTDSATFDLRNGVLQSDKSVYIIGSDMILTLIEPDLDLDNDQAETWDLDLIEWDSDAATITMGDADGEGAAFDPEPLDFRETGDNTGIFQIVIEIPEELANDRLERGEEIVLEYTDWGPSGSDFVGDEDEDVNLTLFTSNFGATIELDQKVYSWTDKVYVTVVAPDHNFDGDLIDEIGNSDNDPIKISTRGFDLDNYKLVETGTDTGIFTGEVILTGFQHDADGDEENDTNPRTLGSGPTDGFLQTDDDDGLTVSFEFSEDETVVSSSLIRWNIGEVQWLEASYPASGTGVVRIIDPDMNLDPEAVDNFDVDVWSDSDAGGIDLTVTETNEATGIYEGTVFFTTDDESSGHRLRVAEGDTVTAEYEDNTLPDPYTTADELDITATTLIGTVVPPLERAPAANLRVVDAFGNSLDAVSVDQQVQISADLANGQDREQPFAYLVQVQDGNGVTVHLAWITGSLSAGQSFSPALSWIPTQAGTYTATAFVWESVDNPTALSPPVSTTITVQ